MVQESKCEASKMTALTGIAVPRQETNRRNEKTLSVLSVSGCVCFCVRCVFVRAILVLSPALFAIRWHSASVIFAKTLPTVPTESLQHRDLCGTVSPAGRVFSHSLPERGERYCPCCARVNLVRGSPDPAPALDRRSPSSEARHRSFMQAET